MPVMLPKLCRIQSTPRGFSEPSYCMVLVSIFESESLAEVTCSAACKVGNFRTEVTI